MTISHHTIDAVKFRRACGTFATGVAIATRNNEEGMQLGLTVNSFTSVSLDPPLILITVQSSSGFLSNLSRKCRFAVNILTSSHRHLSSVFAQRDVDRFNAVNVWRMSDPGIPILPDAASIFQCELYRRLTCGDHVILIGHVIELTCNDAEPLVFHSGQYCRLAREVVA